MGTIAAHFQSYLDFATVDGTVSNGGTWVLLAGPFVLALLGLYIVWNLTAATVSGVRRMSRVAGRLTSGPTVAAVPVPADTASTASVAAFARPRVASARRAEALARSAA